MFNTTFLYLSLSSVSRVPQIILPNFKQVQYFAIQQSIFSKYTSSFLESYTTNHKTEIKNTFFKDFLATPLVFAQNPNCYIGENREWVNDKALKNENFTSNQFSSGEDGRPYFMPSGCGDLLIAGCNFKGLHSWKFGQHSGGGALYVEQKCTVLLHECIFDDCHADNHGGALFIVEKFNGGNVDTDAAFNDDEIPKLTTEFCCFQDCYIYGESNSNSNSKHGVAMYVAALETNISFLTTVRCPGNDGVLHRGAQFDIQSKDDIYSSNINTTGGHSLYCSGIEYRHSKKGVFRFQTVTNMVGKFATSLTSLTVVVDISYCNYLSNTVYYKKVVDADYAALIHVRFSDAKLNNFYFVNTSFKYDNHRSEMVKIIASEFVEKNKEHKKRAIVTDCYTDETGNPDLFVIQSGSINYLNKAQFTTCTIQQLFLGDCKGVKKPDAIIITPIFTHSAVFSYSKEFSESDSFTETGKFTKTDAFSKTSKFSKSDVFSKTNEFSDTGMFSESGLFSTSNTFSQSDDLNRSKIFSSSKKFTKSDYFSKSGFFSDSKYFTSSGQFSKSGFFSDSRYFTSSGQFSKSKCFTGSKHFTKSNLFTDSHIFSKSNFFTSSDSLFIDLGTTKKKSSGAVIGASVGAVAAAAIIAAVVFFIIKKHKSINIPTNDADIVGDGETSVTVGNTLQDIMDADDPFAEEFK